MQQSTLLAGTNKTVKTNLSLTSSIGKHEVLTDRVVIVQQTNLYLIVSMTTTQ